jgi:hypothetical protein
VSDDRWLYTEDPADSSRWHYSGCMLAAVATVLLEALACYIGMLLLR